MDYFYHTDHQGSVQQLTDATGTVVNSYEYDSYGKLISSFETVSQPYGYTAREQDVESDLYYYRARYYDPNTGRFIAEDPIGFDGLDVNIYRYVASNPMNFTDPSGLFLCAAAQNPLVVAGLPGALSGGIDGYFIGGPFGAFTGAVAGGAIGVGAQALIGGPVGNATRGLGNSGSSAVSNTAAAVGSEAFTGVAVGIRNGLNEQRIDRAVFGRSRAKGRLKRNIEIAVGKAGRGAGRRISLGASAGFAFEQVAGAFGNGRFCNPPPEPSQVPQPVTDFGVCGDFNSGSPASPLSS